MMNSTQEKRRLQIASAVGFYFATSLSVVFFNKVVFTAFPYPLFVTWFQIIVAMCCITVLGELGTHFPMFSFMPPFRPSMAVVRATLPLSCVFVGMVSFNNLTLRYVEVSFYQVARSLTIVFNILFTYFLLGKRTSRKAIYACGVIIFGYLLGTEGEVHFSVLGVVFGVCASMFVALYSISVKKVLPSVGNNHWVLAQYNTLNSMFVFVPVVLASNELQGLRLDAEVAHASTWASLTLSGLLGFLISIATFLQIKVTSSLTHNISGTAKACVQTILGVMMWRNPFGFLSFMGTMICIGGSLWYSLIRLREMEVKTEFSPLRNDDEEDK